MADLLGSILGTMQKPPSLDKSAKLKLKEQQTIVKKQQDAEKKLLENFRTKMQKEIHAFVQDSLKESLKFDSMDSVYRGIIHEVAEASGLTSFSFNLSDDERYVMIWKKEFAPSDEELLALRHGKTLDSTQGETQPDEEKVTETNSKTGKNVGTASCNYTEKYKHIIGEESAKDAAKSTFTKRSYGFVSSENKRDQRTIEQVLSDTRAKKKQKKNQDEPPLIQNEQLEGVDIEGTDSRT